MVKEQSLINIIGMQSLQRYDTEIIKVFPMSDKSPCAYCWGIQVRAPGKKEQEELSIGINTLVLRNEAFGDLMGMLSGSAPRKKVKATTYQEEKLLYKPVRTYYLNNIIIGIEPL